VVGKTLPNRGHKQVPVKVTAYVDEGIKDLIELLNTFDGVQTTDSCEGNDSENAYVFMNYEIDGNSNLHQLIDFAQYLVDADRQYQKMINSVFLVWKLVYQ